MSNLIGQTLLNQFRVDSFIASGGMGAVYRVWDIKRNVPLAMKVLNPDLVDDPSSLKYFQREARALQKLAHPNIVPFYGLYQTGDLTFMFEQFIDGPSLRDILRHSSGGLPISDALAIIKALCSALGYSHANGVVHCDIKPNNVLVDRGGHIFLTDFGIARHAESTTTTIAGAGTPAYMAPEQIRGEQVTPATDVYAVGILLYELLTGQRPFRGDEPESANSGNTSGERIRYAHLKLHPPDPCTVNSSVPSSLASIVLKCMTKAPANRYSSTSELLNAINAIGLPIPERVRVDIPVENYAVSPKKQSPQPNTISHPVRGKTPPATLIVIGAIILFLVVAGGVFAGNIGASLFSATLPPISVTEVLIVTDTIILVATQEPTRPDATPSVPPPTDTIVPTSTNTLRPLPSNTRVPTKKPSATKQPTAVPKPKFTAGANMFCRDGPSSAYDAPWQLSLGQVVDVIGVWHQDSNWLLVDINDSRTRTDCCWVGRNGSLNVNLSIIKPIYSLPDRLDCSSVK